MYFFDVLIVLLTELADTFLTVSEDNTAAGTDQRLFRFIDRSNSETDSLFHQKQFWLVHSGLFTAWYLFFQSRHCHNRSAGLSAWLLRH